MLESPDLDAQVASAQAELTFRRQQLARVERLASSGRVSVQDREAADEGVKVARAALVRAQVQKEYQVLRAPFDGTVTARFADPGTLLPAATGSTSSAQPLLEVAQLDRLRVALQLGQDDAARVRVGDKVQLQTSPDQPPFEARISRISARSIWRSRPRVCTRAPSCSPGCPSTGRRGHCFRPRRSSAGAGSSWSRWWKTESSTSSTCASASTTAPRSRFSTACAEEKWSR